MFIDQQEQSDNVLLAIEKVADGLLTKYRHVLIAGE